MTPTEVAAASERMDKHDASTASKDYSASPYRSRPREGITHSLILDLEVLSNTYKDLGTRQPDNIGIVCGDTLFYPCFPEHQRELVERLRKRIEDESDEPARLVRVVSFIQEVGE